MGLEIHTFTFNFKFLKEATEESAKQGVLNHFVNVTKMEKGENSMFEEKPGCSSSSETAQKSRGRMV